MRSNDARAEDSINITQNSQYPLPIEHTTTSRKPYDEQYH